MASRHLRADVCLAWPSAEITVMPPDAAAGIVYRKEIQAAGPDPAAQAATRQRSRPSTASASPTHMRRPGWGTWTR